MASTIARITFIDQPIALDFFRLTVQMAAFPSTQLKGETFKASRVNPGESAIGGTLAITAQNYAFAFEDDYSDLDDFIVTFVDNVVTIECKSGGQYLYFTGYTSKDFVTVELIDPTITVAGLESDRYLINNEIIITIASSALALKYEIVFENTYNQKTSSNITVYPSPSGIANLNISPVIKSLFAYPEDTDNYVVNDLPIANSNKFRITILSLGSEPIELIRSFIRGGKRTNDTNQTLVSGEICRPTELLPVWDGYETAEYYIDVDGAIRKTLVAFVPADDKDFRRSKGCNEVYLKFMNQKGGYSNWLFESHSVTESNSPKGSFIRNNKVDDLGSESDSKMKIYSKVPKYYKAMINDLIVSSDVYAYIDNEYIRVLVSKNSFESGNQKRSYSVNLNIDFEYRFNPSLLWSN